MKPHPLVHLISGGLTASRGRAAELLASMDRPCEARRATGGQCTREGRHRRGARWVCGAHNRRGGRYTVKENIK